MFLIAAKNIVTEPKWLVGLEWDMINLLRDIYCRLVLGQTLAPGGQGPGLQQPKDPNNPSQFEQAKTADRPLQGGGILVAPSNLPRQILANLPGQDAKAVEELEANMNCKRSAKDQASRPITTINIPTISGASILSLLIVILLLFVSQKDFLRDFFRIAAENSHHLDGGRGSGGLFDRAVKEESLLSQKVGTVAVPDIPEKLVTQSMMNKAESKKKQQAPEGLSAFHL